jgi:hypothetical protein
VSKLHAELIHSPNLLIRSPHVDQIKVTPELRQYIFRISAHEGNQSKNYMNSANNRHSRCSSGTKTSGRVGRSSRLVLNSTLIALGVQARKTTGGAKGCSDAEIQAHVASRGRPESTGAVLSLERTSKSL